MRAGNRPWIMLTQPTALLSKRLRWYSREPIGSRAPTRKGAFFSGMCLPAAIRFECFGWGTSRPSRMWP